MHFCLPSFLFVCIHGCHPSSHLLLLHSALLFSNFLSYNWFCNVSVHGQVFHYYHSLQCWLLMMLMLCSACQRALCTIVSAGMQHPPRLSPGPGPVLSFCYYTRICVLARGLWCFCDQVDLISIVRCYLHASCARIHVHTVSTPQCWTFFCAASCECVVIPGASIIPMAFIQD